jgi:hypothetical protein
MHTVWLPILLVVGSLAAAAAQDTPGFNAKLLPVFEKAACRTCHSSDGVASGTRLRFPEEGASAEHLEAFGRSLVRLVDRTNPEKSLLLLKPVNRTAHAGGERISPGSAEEKTLRDWVSGLARMTAPEVEAALRYDPDRSPAPRPRIALRRLTHSQYNNTIRDLTGDISNPALAFPPEDFVDGFKNQVRGQSLSPLLMEAYSAAAEKVARNAFRGGDARNLVGCAPSVACRGQFISQFGRRAFRRPLTASEKKRYDALFLTEREFLQGARRVVEAMLQSPHFLFRLEETGEAAWKPYATASRLAYSLWDSMPDNRLLDAAAQGALSTAAQLEQQTRRLLADDRARPALDEFVGQWLRFDRLLTAAKDRRRFPSFNREVAVSMTEEARRFIADLVWSGRDFRTVFTGTDAYVNGDLAPVYGVPAPSEEFQRVPFPSGSERAGLLGQALFLAVTAKPDDTSPTARGLFVREQFLCQHVADPPPGVNTNLPPVTEAKPQTNRDRLAMHTTEPACAGCHNLIDPIGFAFEKFDAIGGRREKAQITFGAPDKGDGEKARQAVELALDTKGWVAGLKNAEFNSPAGLGAVLANAEVCQECLVKQYFRWVAGRVETPSDRPLIRRTLEAFRRSGFRYQELMAALVLGREAIESETSPERSR